MDYRSTIGLEIHAQLSLNSKMFAPEMSAFGALPNTLVSPVSLAHPGTLPTINKKAIDYAIKLGLACHCDITHLNYFDRKNYYYPDLPKGYQITQDQTPICRNGYICYEDNKTFKHLDLERIHMEEDAGKSIHDISDEFTFLDYNRAGIALLEIVTKPQLHSGQEAFCFVTELRRLLRYLEICDGNMEKGSLRCDANISVTKTDNLGQKVEVKNMNSIKNIQLAIEYEIERQINELEQGKEVIAETRMFDALTKTTKHQRYKSDAIGYHYFTEPDLHPIYVSDEWINSIKETMPLLPQEYKQILQNKYGLNEYASSVLIDDKNFLMYFIKASEVIQDYKNLVNWIIGPIKSYLNNYKISLHELNLSLQTLKELLNLVNENVVSYTVAHQNIFPLLIDNPNKTARQIAEELNVIQNSNDNEIEQIIKDILSQYPDKVKAYKNGKKGILGMFMGEIMKQTQGSADPKLANTLLLKYLEDK